MCLLPLISITVKHEQHIEIIKAFIYLGGLANFFGTWGGGTEKIDGLWFARGVSNQTDTMSSKKQKV